MKRGFQIAVLSILSFTIGLGNLTAQQLRPDYQHQAIQTSRAQNEQTSWRGDEHNNRSYYQRPYVDDRNYYGADYGGDDYDHGDHHSGRSVAIIGGSAAAGAFIGAAAGHEQGAVVGAVIGGIAGFVADEAVRHNDRDRR